MVFWNLLAWYGDDAELELFPDSKLHVFEVHKFFSVWCFAAQIAKLKLIVSVTAYSTNWSRPLTLTAE